MKDPIKIIHKFKNNNRSIQYKVFIFIGPLLSEELTKILKIIENKDFFNSLLVLNNKQYEELEKYYGEFWYQKFFISYHLKSQIKQIDGTTIKKKQIISKFGDEWYKKHINVGNFKKISYSFAASYYENLLDKKKIILSNKKPEIDFRTITQNDKINLSEILESNEDQELNEEDQELNEEDQELNEEDQELNEEDQELNEEDQELLGGDEDDDDIVDLTDDLVELTDDFVDDNKKGKKSKKKTDDEEEELNEEDLDEMVEEDFDLDEIVKLYSNENLESNKTIQETQKLISEAINDKKWEKKIDDFELKYDKKLDSINFNANLEDVFNKFYITDEYIFKDDNIKVIKNKICTTIELSDIFGKGIKLIPEAQYFWSEYNGINGKEEIMIGQKWIRRNELLKIDIKPNENLKVYEKLRNNLSYLKDAFGYKIKREDDETNILRFYDEFMTMNEIFMLDIFNDLGTNYNSDAESKRNLFDVYINIYFPLITFDRFEGVVNLLNGKGQNELALIESEYLLLKNDCKIEKEIYTTVEKSKNDLQKFDKYFLPNHIIQSNIHVNINDPKNLTGTNSDTKYNLYRIFDNFTLSEKYPFIQYQTPDGQITYKYYTQLKNIENSDTLAKWFENAPYGISFKVFVNNDKYVAINLHESGRVEYKITWKEDDKATVDDIIKSYEYVRDILKKINNENKKIKFVMPHDDKFKYAFINTIQKFSIPENFKINHNDLSEFCRFFYPYVSLVIEPKKRVSKKGDTNESVSKFGTYLRYKRISKFENRTKLHLRILYFLRNYELNERDLIDEISKQFNITQEQTIKELDFVKDRYGKAIKKSKKLLKKLKSLPKSKPPGIGIDIQGRDTDKYKIRITGARTKEQLEEIVSFMKVLIFLYTETYLYKKKSYEKIKDLLKSLTKIAKRRNKVVEIVNYEAGTSLVKQMTSLDKKRLGFKPEKGQSQWTRNCQNSGNDKKRRPHITSGTSPEKLLKNGYKLNEKTGYYEKTVNITIRKKVHQVTLKALKLVGDENTYNFYTCDPSENNEFMYIGFLSRGNNPSDLCMPCCFKKDQMYSANKSKKNYYLKCIGEESQNKNTDNTPSIVGEKLYILQDTNKVQDNRFIYLPKYLDILFNKAWNHDNKIKNHYLYESKSGYFFKYTVKNDKYNFLATISNIFEKSIEELIKIAINFMNNDNKNVYFTYLNNGDIKESFKSKGQFINYIESSNYLEYDILGELFAIPGVLTKNGLNYFILEKKNLIVKKNLEKDQIIERYFMNCLNYENNHYLNEDRDYIIIIKDNKNYFPIYRVKKEETKDKKIILEKIFNNSNKNVTYIINELKNYYNQSCTKNYYSKIIGNFHLFNKNIINLLQTNNIKIKKQIIDDRNKCKYIILDSGITLPVYPSGITYNYGFETIELYNGKLLNLDDTLKELKKINELIKMEYIPKIVFYDKKDKTNIHIISILLENELIIPIKFENLDEKYIQKLGLSIRFQSLEEEIDKEINYFTKNQVKYIDSRLLRVKQHIFKNESYNIFRLELSLFLSENIDIKEKIMNIVKNSKITYNDKKYELRRLIFKMTSSKLFKDLGQQGGNNIFKQQSGGESFVNMVNEIKDIENYNVSNLRDYCEINKTQLNCNNNLHCSWSNNLCKMRLDENMLIDFVNKIIEEMVQNDIQFKELLQEGNYYVSDIVDYSQYTNRPGQKIIKTGNYNISKIMAELFSKDKIPTIGKRQIINKSSNEINEDYLELIELGKQLIQPIISNKDSILRAYVNCFYWINNPLYDVESRNIGYFSEIQTQLTNQFKAKIIDFLFKIKNENQEKYTKYIKKYFNGSENDFIDALNKFRKQSYNSDGKLELYILSFIIDTRIVIYNNFNVVIGLYLNGEVPINDETIKNFTDEQYRNKTIFIKMDFDGSNKIPKNIYSIYYL
jgi:hypothetical protein